MFAKIIAFFKSLFTKPAALPAPIEGVVKVPVEDEKEVPLPAPTPDDPPWLVEMRKMKGKREDDPAFEKEVTPYWKKLFNRSISGIRGNAKAWCGLGAGIALFLAGYAVPHHGEVAYNWRKDPNFVYLDYRKVGIPKGAFLGINHQGKCDGESGNHITISDGQCSVADSIKPGATVNGTGANQNNQVGTNAYCIHGGCAKTHPNNPNEVVCTVGWPAKAPLPAPVKESKNCTGKNNGGSTT